jgi:nitric oxide reductase subunit C
MMPPQSKKVLLVVLVSAFVVQSALVYSDQPTGRLDEAGVRGRMLWHKRGCQVCHQLYGQGGFLGPDLTNAFSRVDSTRLRTLLTLGSGQMPAFHLRDAEIADLRAFLRGMDRPSLGQGQLRLGHADPRSTPWARFGLAVVTLLEDSSAARKGWEAFQARPCVACHIPLAASPAGPPDLSRTAERLSRAEMREVLTSGRLIKGMPPPTPPFSEREMGDVMAFLEWLAEHRDSVDARMQATAGSRKVRWRDIPWWEYK